MEVEQLLKQLGIAYIPMSEEQIVEHKQMWVKCLVPVNSHAKAAECYCLPNEDGYSDYLWHAFSFELLDSFCGNEARIAFDRAARKKAILLSNWDDAGFHIFDASALTARNLENIADVVLTSADFKWTYAKTHEDGLGPYFHSAE